MPPRTRSVTGYDGPFLARAEGILFLLGGSLALVWLALPHPGPAERGPLLVLIGSAVALSAALLTGRLDGLPIRVFEVILLLGTLMMTLALWVTDAQQSGFAFFYLWNTPYAFCFFGPRHAAVHTVLTAACFGTVLALRSDASLDLVRFYHGGGLALWLFVVGTVVIVGVLVNQLARFLRDAADERLELTGQLLRAHDEARQRVAADIHDDSLQVLTALDLRLQLLARHLEEPGARELVESLGESLQSAMDRLRNLLFSLWPPALGHEGLDLALAAQLAGMAAELGFEWHVSNWLVTQPSREEQTVLYRIAQEALTNVAKHAAAKRVRVVLEDHRGGVRMQVRDDGAGFDPSASSDRAGHLGLVSMRERAAVLGGTLEVRSQPGRGTVVEVWLPRHTIHAAPSGGAGATSQRRSRLMMPSRTA